MAVHDKGYIHIRAAQTDEGLYGVARVKGKRNTIRVEGICSDFNIQGNISKNNGLFFYGGFQEFALNFRRPDRAIKRAELLFPHYMQVGYVPGTHTSRAKRELGFARIPIDELELSPEQVRLAEDLISKSYTVIERKEIIPSSFLSEEGPQKRRQEQFLKLNFPKQLTDLIVQKGCYFDFMQTVSTENLDRVSSVRMPGVLMYASNPRARENNNA